jgi:hypothetical protein
MEILGNQWGCHKRQIFFTYRHHDIQHLVLLRKLRHKPLHDRYWKYSEVSHEFLLFQRVVWVRCVDFHCRSTGIRASPAYFGAKQMLSVPRNSPPPNAIHCPCILPPYHPAFLFHRPPPLWLGAFLCKQTLRCLETGTLSTCSGLTPLASS